jgi:hypothetical protein
VSDRTIVVVGENMSTIIDLSCMCGTVKGKLNVVKGSFFHIHCLCCDCQSFATHLNNKEKILDEHGGTELFQTYPAYMEITDGQENIGCVQLREKGLYRWHTKCCNMPLANTMRSSKLPFVGVSVKLMQFNSDQEKMEILGPVSMKAFGKYSIGKMPTDVHPKFPLSYMPKIIGFMLKGMLGKKNSPSPFFKDGAPVTKANVL